MKFEDSMHVAFLRKAYPALDGLTPRQAAALQRYADDVFVAGRAQAERPWARPSHAKLTPKVESRRTRWFWRGIELLASFTTLAGMWEGSTTVVGALWYLVAGVAFTAVSFKRRLHGLQPLNFAGLAIESINLVQALR